MTRVPGTRRTGFWVSFQALSQHFFGAPVNRAFFFGGGSSRIVQIAQF